LSLTTPIGRRSWELFRKPLSHGMLDEHGGVAMICFR